MKIGVDLRSLLEGRMSGVGEYTYRIMRALLSEDTKNEYVFFLNSYQSIQEDFSWIEKYDNATLHRNKWPNKLLNFLMWYIRWPMIDRFIGGVDVFFAPNIGFIPLSHHSKLVLTLHDLSFELYPETFSWKRRLWHVFIHPRKLCQRADKVVAVSRSTAEDAIRYYGLSDKKVVPIHNAVADSFQEISRNSEQIMMVKKKYGLPYKFILYFGTIEPRKNIVSVIRSYNAFRDHGGRFFADHKLVIAGQKGWKISSISHEIEMSRYKKDIIVTGCIDPLDKPAVYTMANIFVYTSLYEGFGFPVLEAMRCGTPVITSNTSSLAEISGDAAILVDPYKPHEIHRSLIELSKDKKLYEFYVQKGMKHSMNFRWKKSAQEMLKVFDELKER